MPGQISPADDKNDKSHHYCNGGDHSHFLSNHRQNKIRVLFRKEPEFLPPVSEAKPAHTAVAQGEHRLPGLVTDARFVFFWIPPKKNATPPHRIINQHPANY